MSSINRILLIMAGLLLVAAAGLLHAQSSYNGGSNGADVSVSVSVQAGYSPTHYCTWSYGYYYCYGSSPGYLYTPYCDYFDPYYSRYCYPPYYGYYPTYVVNPGTIVYVNGAPYSAAQPQPAINMTPCSDGTPAGMCSTDSPKYCFNGQLFDKATLCGCPAGQVPDPTNRNRCVAQTCSDGTALNTCSTSKPQFCTANGVLVERPTQCGCPTGTKLEGSSCVPLNAFCAISSVSPSAVQTGGNAIVTVRFNELASAPRGNVDCGNGQLAELSCIQLAGSTSGSCTATCTYNENSQDTVARTVRASVGGKVCSNIATVSISPQPVSTGNVLVKVTSCDSGQAVPGAAIFMNGARAATNANGEAQFANVAPGSNDVSASASGFQDASATALIETGRTTILPVCLRRETRPSCDVSVSFAGNVAVNQLPTQLQLRLTNNVPENNSVTLTYSGFVPVDGPVTLELAPSETRVITLTPRASPTLAGSSLLSVTAVGNRATCSANAVFPFSLNSGVSLEPLQTQRTVHPGEKVCFDFLARNRAAQKADVLLSASSVHRTELQQERFSLAPFETRQLQACVFVPEGATGSSDLTLTADSNLNDAQAVFTVNTQRNVFSNVQGCYQLNGTGSQYVEVKLSNEATGASFEAKVEPAGGLRASLAQDQVFNFRTQSTRSVFLRVDADSLENGRGQATISLYSKQTGQRVLQEQLCFVARGWFDSSQYLAPTRLEVIQGNTVHTFLTIRNTGSSSDTYEVEVAAPFESISVSRARASLQPTASTNIDIAVRPTAATQPGTYVVPISVYSLGASLGHRALVSSLNLVVDVKPVVPTTQLRLVLSSQPVVELRRLDNAVKVFVNVSNFEDDPRTIAPSVEGLPAGWNYTIAPTSLYLQEMQSGQFEYTITYKDLQAEDYNVTLVFTDETGRQVRHSVVLPAKSSGWVTGFFTLATGDVFLGIIVLLLVIGLYLTYRSWAMRQELRKQVDLS